MVDGPSVPERPRRDPDRPLAQDQLEDADRPRQHAWVWAYVMTHRGVLLLLEALPLEKAAAAKVVRNAATGSYEVFHPYHAEGRRA